MLGTGDVLFALLPRNYKFLNFLSFKGSWSKPTTRTPHGNSTFLFKAIRLKKQFFISPNILSES